MIYGLVIVTSLGAATMLGTFLDRVDCLKEAAMIAQTPQASAQCWPGSSKDNLEKRVEQINSAISNTIKK
jgi:hypothetical protein